MDRIDLTDRAALQEIRRLAQKKEAVVISQSWKHAYQRLADAADTLDAMYARCTNYENAPPTA